VTPEVEKAAPAKAHETELTVATLGLIAEHLSEPLYAKNANLEFVLLNSAFCAWVGRQREELIGRTETEVYRSDLAADHEGTDREVLNGQPPVTAQERFELGDGREQERAITKLPIADASGAITHVVCVVGHAGASTVSAQQLQQELERYAQERTRALRDVQDQLLRKERLMVLGQLAAGLAHQIRNPLAAIANALSIVRRQMPPQTNQTVNEALQIAGDEIWEANRIIGDLLDYARIRPPKFQGTPLIDSIRSALDAEPIGEHVEVELDVPDIIVHVDEHQVSDALRNLIRNAGEAMPTRGKLSFRARVAGKYAELLIQDTGEGVPVEHRNLLFEPLVTSKPLGIGLGLPTARALIVNQGGTLECIDAEIGRSSRASDTPPRSDAAANLPPPIAPLKPLSAASLGAKTEPGAGESGNTTSKPGLAANSISARTPVPESGVRGACFLMRLPLRQPSAEDDEE
jgi:PAS domain S-box-containing protein